MINGSDVMAAIQALNAERDNLEGLAEDTSHGWMILEGLDRDELQKDARWIALAVSEFAVRYDLPWEFVLAQVVEAVFLFGWVARRNTQEAA